MSTSSVESIPPKSNLGTAHRDSLPFPHDQAQIDRAAPPLDGNTSGPSTAAHSTSEVSTAVHNHWDRVKPAWIVGRYGRTVKLVPPYIKLELDPATTSFVDDNEPKNWTRLVHPEGALYWVYSHQQGDKAMPIYTDAYLCDEEICGEVENFRDAILGKVEPERMPAEWELVLDLSDAEDPHESTCFYYFVNSSNRTLFWFHPLDLRPLLNGLFHVKSKRRIQQLLETFYWRHWEMYPHDREVPEKLLKEVTGIMIHAGIDNMTSHESTSIYTGEQLQAFISYVKEIPFIGRADGYSACVVGRLMGFLTHGRYINFFGQREARLSADQSVFDGKDKKERRTWLIKSASYFLLFAPQAHLKELESVYTDFVIFKHKWTKFIEKMQSEWVELVRIGTVLLTANVAFLAIPSVDTTVGGSLSGHYPRNAAQVASYLSVIFSMGCMASGVLLIRYHTSRPHDSADQADKYLRDYHHANRGLETLAILYSLPYSSLLWAMVSFFVAFFIVALIDSEGKWQRYPSGTVMAVFLVLLVWCVWMTREERPGCVERACYSLRRFLTLNRRRHPPSQLRKHEGHETTPFQSIQVDPSQGSTKRI